MKPATTVKVRIELFGGPSIRMHDGSVITFQAKPATVLALLSLAPGNRLTRDELSGAIWPDEDPIATRARLRTALATLRSAIPCGKLLIPSHTHVVSLNRAVGITIDIEEFEALLVRSRVVDEPQVAIAALERILTVGSDRFAPGIYAEPVVRAAGRVEMHLEEAKERLSQLQAGETTVSGCGATTEEHKRVSGSARKAVSSRHSAGGFARLGVILALVALAVVVLRWTRGPVLVPDQNIPTSQRLRILDQARYTARQETSDELNRRRSRQAEQCLALAEQAWRSWYGPDEQRWIAIIMQIDGDIHNSLRWLVEHNAPAAMRLAGCLSRYWAIEDKQDDARQWLQAAMKRSPSTDSEDLARAMAVHAMCCLESTAMDRPEARRANAAALKEMQDAYAMFVRLKDRPGQAHSLRCLGHLYHSLRRWVEADQCFKYALQMFREDGNSAGEGYTLWGMSLVSHPKWSVAGRAMREASLRLRSEHILRKVGNQDCLAFVFRELSNSIDSIEAYPGLASRSAFRPILSAYANECRCWLERPEAKCSPSETLTVRRRMARLAVSLHDRNSAVEQLGFILSDIRDIHGARAIRLFGAYIEYCGRLTNKPLSESQARGSAYGEAQSQPELHLNVPGLLDQGRHMTLADAVDLAST